MAEESCTLFERTKQLLEHSEQTYLEIYAKTGLTPHWLSLFRNGRYRDPSVNKIQKLYECLRGEELHVR